MPTNQAAERIAANVRAEAARQQIAQGRIAEHLRLTQPGLSRRMRGRVPFSAHELVAIAELFNVPVGELVGEAVA